MSLSTDDGKKAVALARSTLDAFVRGRKEEQGPSGGFLSDLRGVFVTLNSTRGDQEKLRGCIGFPYPVKKLGDAIREATVAAASEDPRFPPVSTGELDDIVVEVSVLTTPEELEVPRRQEAPKSIRIGEDGLIISTSYTSGLLLPQVASEFGMDAEEFLSQACMKAGLTPDSWLDPGTKIQTFQADIFAETRPRGQIERVKL